MTEPPRLDLGERRLGAILRDSLRVYFRHFGAFLAIGLVVVVPVELIVSGVGLDQFARGADQDPPVEAAVVSLVVHALVTTPLVAAMTVYAVLRLADGQPPSARHAIQAGLDIFRPMLWPVAIAIAVVGASAAVAVGLALEVDEGLGALVLIPLFLYLRWYFAPQAVVAGRARGIDALRESWKLTGGSVLRVAGVLVLAALLLGIAGQVVAVPLLAIAQGADSGPLFVLYGALAQALATPAVAIVGVLLYFDLRARS